MGISQVNLIPPRHGGNIREEARRIGVRTEQLLDASASIVPFTPPRAIHNCLVQTLSNNSLRHYPDSTHLRFREAISNWHKVPPDMVLPGNGASELFTWAARYAATKGLNGLPSPGFADYVRALECWNASYRHLPLPLTWNTEVPQAFPLSPTTDVLWITNPHNPTGQLWSKKSIEPLINNHAFVICDEAFIPLVPNGERESLIPLVSKYSNLIVIRSLTKLFALPGLRLGYAIGSPQILETWSKCRDPWPLNALAIAAGTKLMSDGSGLDRWITRVQRWVSKEGAWLHTQLEKIPEITPLPSSTNFLLIKSNSSLIYLREKIAKKNILLRDCRSFVELGESYLRISLQTRRDNQRIIKALRENIK